MLVIAYVAITPLWFHIKSCAMLPGGKKINYIISGENMEGVAYVLCYIAAIVHTHTQHPQ